MKSADPYPLMFSQTAEHLPRSDLPECYQGDVNYCFKYKEERFYNDSNFYGDPFEDEDPDFQFNPITEKSRSSSHDILGVDCDSSEAEIKKAFFKRAKETHPDKIGGDGEEFRKVRQAYDCLIS